MLSNTGLQNLNFIQYILAKNVIQNFILFTWLTNLFIYFLFQLLLELHFKLATRRLSASSTSKLDSLGQMEKSISVDQRERPPVENKLENEVFRDADEKLRFEKILKTLGRKEPNLDHRLDELKYMYELNKYDELLTRLKDAESKNEYLAKVIAQLEARRDGDQK